MHTSKIPVKDTLRSNRVFFYLFFISLILGFVCIFLYLRKPAGWRYTLSSSVAMNMALPKVFQSLSFKGSSLYFSGLDNITNSLAASSGRLQWRHEEQSYSIYLSEFGQNNQLFLTNFDGNLYALNKDTGDEFWRYTTPDRTKIDTEPVITKKDVLFGSRNGTLYAVDKESGTLHWTYATKQIDTTHYKHDEIILHFGRFSTDDTAVYLNSATEKKLIAIDLATGKDAWQVDLENYYFNKPQIFDSSIGYWDSPTTYKLIDKLAGKTLLTLQATEETFYLGGSCIYLTRADDAIECFSPNTGHLIWKAEKPYSIPSSVKEINSNITLITYPNVTSTVVVAVDPKNGSQIWSHSFSNIQNFTYHAAKNGIVAIGQSLQCSLSITGEIYWCSDLKGDISTSFATSQGIFIVAKQQTDNYIYLLNVRNGKIKWKYTSKDINLDTIHAFEGNIYFLNKKNDSITMLNATYPGNLIQEKELMDMTPVNNILSYIFFIKYQLILKFQDLKITTEQPQKFVLKNDIFELTLRSNNKKGNQLNTNYKIKLVSPTGKEYLINGFYYDLKTWKFRFSPDTLCIWMWTLVSAALIDKKYSEGNFLVSDSTNQGFIFISKTNPKFFEKEDGRIFLPVGIQNCVNDLHHNGNPLNAWPLDDEIKGSDDALAYKTTTVDDYLTTYADSGFNTYRWGAGNCSFTLWNFGRSNNNGPKVNEGILLDTIFTSLKRNNYHTWVSLFSFDLPFDKDLPMVEQQRQIKEYLDYTVSRYAAFVDVWELANEIRLNDELIHFMTRYIRSIDPYKHPITTSWERPDLQDIEATSYHWYSGECNEYCDQDLAREIDKFDKYNKPLIFSEQGNNFANWDELSPIRFRIRLWLSFFRQASLISWNMPNVYFENKTGPSNVYIGPIERSYASIFAKHTDLIGTDIQKYTISAEDKKHKVFAIISADIIYGYVYTKIFNPEKTSAKITLSVDTDGTIQWINPGTGEIISEQNISKGKNTILTPTFTTDLLFRFKK